MAMGLIILLGGELDRVIDIGALPFEIGMLLADFLQRRFGEEDVVVRLPAGAEEDVVLLKARRIEMVMEEDLSLVFAGRITVGVDARRDENRILVHQARDVFLPFRAAPKIGVDRLLE